jgi:hypothetical protein
MVTNDDVDRALKAYELGATAKSFRASTGIDILAFILGHSKPDAVRSYEMGVSAKNIRQTSGIDILGFILSHAKPDTETKQEGAKDTKNVQRMRCQVHRLYELGADVSFISELTSLSPETIFCMVPELAPCLVSVAQPTKQAMAWVDGKRVSFDTEIPVEAPTPSLKERLIDRVLEGPTVTRSDENLKPLIKVRALDTYNGFQGNPTEKAVQAINHAYTELSTGN